MCRWLLATLLTSCTPAPTSAPPAWHVVFDQLPAPLFSIWQADDGVLYAVGGAAGRSLVLRHDKNGWWTMDPGTSAPLWWVFGFSSTHVYAVGERGTITYFGGQRWEVFREGSPYTLYGVWGANPSDLWAVGGSPTLSQSRPVTLRSQGGSWQEVDAGLRPAASLFKVWGTAADNVYVVGEGGLLARFNGERFVEQQQPATTRLVTVFGSGADSVFAVGGAAGPELVHFDGGSWARLPPPGDQGRTLFGGATGAGREIVIVGELGYLAQGSGTSMQVAAAGTGDCLHAVTPTTAGFAAVGGDLQGKLSRGVLIARGGLQPGALQAWPWAGRALAPPLDAGSLSDGGSGADGGTIAPGGFCDARPSGCGPLDECWLLIGPNRAICTRLCPSALDCGAFGPGACCLIPGPQVTTPTCVPAGIGACPPRDGG